MPPTHPTLRATGRQILGKLQKLQLQLMSIVLNAVKTCLYVTTSYCMHEHLQLRAVRHRSIKQQENSQIFLFVFPQPDLMDASSIIQLFLSANAQLYHFFLPGASAKFLILTSLESQTRTTEYLRLEGTHQHHCCLQIYIKLNHLIKSLIQMLLEHCQA